MKITIFFFLWTKCSTIKVRKNVSVCVTSASCCFIFGPERAGFLMVRSFRPDSKPSLISDQFLPDGSPTATENLFVKFQSEKLCGKDSEARLSGVKRDKNLDVSIPQAFILSGSCFSTVLQLGGWGYEKK